MARLCVEKLPGKQPHYTLKLHGEVLYHSPRVADVFAARWNVLRLDKWLHRMVSETVVLNSVVEV